MSPSHWRYWTHRAVILAGTCLILAGCGGGDIPDPSADSAPDAAARSAPVQPVEAPPPPPVAAAAAATAAPPTPPTAPEAPAPSTPPPAPETPAATPAPAAPTAPIAAAPTPTTPPAAEPTQPQSQPAAASAAGAIATTNENAGAAVTAPTAAPDAAAPPSPKPVPDGGAAAAEMLALASGTTTVPPTPPPGSQQPGSPFGAQQPGVAAAPDFGGAVKPDFNGPYNGPAGMRNRRRDDDDDEFGGFGPMKDRDSLTPRGTQRDAKPVNYNNPRASVQAFLDALKAKDVDRLSEATALRSPYESSPKHQDLFRRIVDGSISEAQLNDLAENLDDYKISGEAPVTSTGRIGILVTKPTKNGRMQRKITVRKEKAGWKVLDVSSIIEFKNFRRYTPPKRSTTNQ